MHTHIPLYHEDFVKKVVVGENTHRGVERILIVTRSHSTRSVVLAGGWSFGESLFSFPLDPTAQLVVEPAKLIELIVSLISCQHTRRDKAVKQGLCECGEWVNVCVRGKGLCIRQTLTCSFLKTASRTSFVACLARW